MENLKKVFLDSNIIFSASLGGAAFQLLWELSRQKKLELYSSNYCLVEALDNLQHLYPDKVSNYNKKIMSINILTDYEASDWAKDLLPEKDALILETAVQHKMKYLITGDKKHFGKLMERNDLKIKILTIKSFLLNA
ncbi:MAG: hypothetical protein ACD_79C00408G0002 [uncultured bacterium]|nr:MAG: hypothetical protein ACD_79C00408G0002 [uncultured bacterium]